MTSPRKYRKKPVEVEVMGPLTMENITEIAKWSRSAPGLDTNRYGTYMFCRPTDSGLFFGDYLTREIISGDEYWRTMSPDIFEATYEPVEDAGVEQTGDER